MKKTTKHASAIPVAHPGLMFQAVETAPQGVDNFHLSKEYAVSVTEFLADLGRSGVVTRVVIHGRNPGARLRIEDAQAVKRAILGDVEAVMLLGCDARARDCQPPGTMLLWCLAPGETWPLGSQGELPAGTVPELLRFRDALPVTPVVAEEPTGAPDFVMGETEGAAAARVMLDGVPVLDVQRARTSRRPDPDPAAPPDAPLPAILPGWVEVAVRRNRASGRVRCLPVGAQALQAPRDGEFWFPEGGNVESLRTAEGFALRILSGRVKVLFPKPEPVAGPAAPAEPPADAPAELPAETAQAVPSEPAGDAPPVDPADAPIAPSWDVGTPGPAAPPAAPEG